MCERQRLLRLYGSDISGQSNSNNFYAHLSVIYEFTTELNFQKISMMMMMMMMTMMTMMMMMMMMMLLLLMMMMLSDTWTFNKLGPKHGFPTAVDPNSKDPEGSFIGPEAWQMASRKLPIGSIVSMGRLYIYLHENHKNQPFM